MFFSVTRFAQLLGVFATLFSFVNAIDTLTVKGRHFVNSRTGEIVMLQHKKLLTYSSFGLKEQM
jgi:uncharacterized membrane protein